MALTRLKSINDFVKVWFNWKNYAVLTFFIIVFLVMIFAYVYTPYYVTTAKILILPRTSEGVIISTGTDEARIAQVSPQDVNSEIELITNGDVIRETVMSFKREGKGLALSAPREAWYEKIITEIKYYIKTLLVYLKLVVPIPEFESKVNQLTNAIEVEPVAMSNIIVVELEAERPKLRPLS